MDETARHARRVVLFHCLPAFVVGGWHDRRAKPPDRTEFRLRRRIHHHHRAGDAGVTRRQGHTLRGIARADGPHPVAHLIARQLADGVMRTTDLEGTNRL
jgi:hypothetical protein